MKIYDIIDKKRHGAELSLDEIQFVIDKYMTGEIADYQMSSLLMAICINSMTARETAYLTNAMMNSGDVLDLSQLGGTTVDKHSTGGIGDKTTLIVAPIVASLGGVVAKMSGRGLGFTGGTIDKLESVGVKVELSSEEFLGQAKEIGISVVGQSATLAPADKRLYALRDVTATIDSVPLIASSIMSKKLASGSKSIVLDVKAGTGAFMKDEEGATELASAMINIGRDLNRNVIAIISDMNVPLGYAIGNSVEVWEATKVLSGRGEKNLTELCKVVSASMLSLALKIEYEDALLRVDDAISSGKALSKFYEWIQKQGGDVSKIKDSSYLLGAPHRLEIKAKQGGYISELDALKIGNISMHLGAGRIKKEDRIDPQAGVILNKTYGDYIECGEVLATLYTSSPSLLDGCESRVLDAVKITSNKPKEKTLIYKVMK
ncbi:MAG: thymidine phosphorylase [Clostridia bacterium]|nr:thymidine phosphorylase [Clostridia bacterium]